MEGRRTLPEILAQISYAAIPCMLYNIPYKMTDGIPVTFYALFFAYALISYLCSRIFFRKPKSLPAVAVLNLILICAGMAAYLLSGQITGVLSGIFTGVFLLVLSLMAYRETVLGININTLTFCFDILVVLLLIYTLVIELGPGRMAAALPGVVGIIASFSGIMLLRDANRISIRDRSFSAVIILAVIAAAFLIRFLAGNTLREGISGVFSGIGAALAWLGNLITQILLFLSRFFKDPDVGPSDPDLDGGISISGAQGMEEVSFSPVPLLIAAAVLAAAAAVAAVLIFRKRRLSGRKTEHAVKQVSRDKSGRVSLRNALRIWAKEKMYRIRVRIFFMKNRKTPAARFYRLVRSRKRSSTRIRQGETPGEFLERYIESLEPDDKRIPELKTLIEELNIQLYRGKSDILVS